MKNVLMTLYGPLESDARVLRSIETFKEKDYSITIFTVGTNPNFIPPKDVIIINKNFKHVGFLNYLLFSISLCFYVLKTNKIHNVYYMHDYYACFPGYILSIFTNKPIYYDAHELILKRKKDIKNFRDMFFLFFEKLFVRKVKHIIEANKERAVILRRLYHLNNVSDVMNISSYLYKDINRSYEKGNFIMVYQGAITEERHLSFFIKILLKLPEYVKLVLIGDGPDLSLLRQKTIELHLEDRVSFTGRLNNSEMMEKLTKCHLGLVSYSFTSLNSIFCSPNKIFEYSAISLPILSTSQPFIKKIANQYKIGRTFQLDNEDSFISNFLQIINNYDQYSQGFESFLSDYNYKNENSKLKDILNDC